MRKWTENFVEILDLIKKKFLAEFPRGPLWKEKYVQKFVIKFCKIF